MQKIIFDNISAVLIDLDGTFADTTIDMCNALNNILWHQNDNAIHKQMTDPYHRQYMTPPQALV